MMRVKTLKNLFPEPQPPRSKNFIKENVKSVRKMEKLFHPNDDVKCPNLSIPKQTKVIKRNNANKNNYEVRKGKVSSNEQEAEKIIQNGVSKLLNHKTVHENQNIKKKSIPIVSNKKNIEKKSRDSVDRNVIRQNHASQSEDGCAIEDKKLKTLSEGDLSCEKLNDELTNDTKVKCISQGVQTLNADDVESIYLDGIIRYPSARNQESQTPKTLDRGDAEVPENIQSKVKNNAEHSSKDCFDRVKVNKERVSLASKLASQLNNSTPSLNHRAGVVPKYIKERKQALQKEQQAKAAAKYVDCPAGHIPLPDNERKETLNMLKKNYQDFVRELNMLPIRTDTLRSQKRKMEIEKQLAKLEEAIKVFSRPKVFVKVDA